MAHDCQDGNVYKTISLGTRRGWTENLRTTKYRNGEAILEKETAKFGMGQLLHKLIPVIIIITENNDTNCPLFGRLYNCQQYQTVRNIATFRLHFTTDA